MRFCGSSGLSQPVPARVELKIVCVSFVVTSISEQ